MRPIGTAIFLLAFATLVVELSLIRAFDVIFRPNWAYMIITSALFAFGLSGIVSVFRPVTESVRPWLGRYAAAFAFATLAIMPVANVLPFHLRELQTNPLPQLFFFATLYLVLLLPFFFSGLVFVHAFTAYGNRIQLLYFFDLCGAALGALALLPLVRMIGPGGLLLCAAACGLVAASLFRASRSWHLVAIPLALVLAVAPFARRPVYFDFVEHHDKRGVKSARKAGHIERTIWDPVSKIDIVHQPGKKHIAYDGGSQSSHFFPFDGDFDRLRQNLHSELKNHFWSRAVLASHYLRRGSEPDVLVIGSAGGQEIKAALLYGARSVEGVEMVRAVVELGSSDYGSYIGELFQHPKVRVHVDEGRNFLRGTDRRYDVIQVFSNHTSSAVAAGTGAIATTYLQTAEAYAEFFSHLRDDGVLQVNHHIYPRMITTAAAAWARLGRTSFRRHVAVFGREGFDTLPSLLISMRPWSEEEITDLRSFFGDDFEGDPRVYRLLENPLRPSDGFLSDDLFSGTLSKEARRAAAYRLSASTDDRPYFNLIRSSLQEIEPSAATYTNESIATMLNSFMNLGPLRVPVDIAPLSMTVVVAVSYAFVFILVPLRLSSLGRRHWEDKMRTLVYFSLLGAAFIIIEIVLIQMFLKVIGAPALAAAAVLFGVLFGAGCGSWLSGRVGLTPERGWAFAFLGVLVAGLSLIVAYPYLLKAMLGAGGWVKGVVTVAAIWPLAVFMGMPFPLGILALRRLPRTATAWAWGMNGMFTVVGGVLAILLSLWIGFRATLLGGLALYLGAFLAFPGGRRTLSKAGGGRPRA